MKTGSKNSCKCLARSGLTLLEVLAGLALLATLLAGVLTAYGNHVRQVRRTQLRLKAADAADRMLTDWFQRPGGFPEEGCGTVPADVKIDWRTRRLKPLLAEREEDIPIVRLEMFDGKAKEKNPEVEPILVIDLASSATAKQPRGQGQ